MNTKPKQTVGLGKVAQVVEEFRKLHPEMQMQTALMFLYVALYDGLSMKELCERVGIAQSTGSRNIQLLGDGTMKITGYNLVKAQVDPYDTRRKTVVLTPKGLRLAGSLQDIVNR